MAEQVEVVLDGEVLFTGDLDRVPYAFWHRVIAAPETDINKLVEKLQATNARWEGFLNVHGAYVLDLPPLFHVNKIQTVF